MMLGVSQPLKDIRPRAEEKARRKAEELREQTGDTVRPPGTGFETERARAKQALRDEVNAQTGQSVRKIAATSGPAVNDDRILRVAAYCRVSTDDIDQVISIELQKNNYRDMMLTWWAYQDPAQELLSPEIILEIEHIYARNRQEKEHSLSNPRNVESLGNKALLEKRINIRASDYRFADKTKYYMGFENARKQKKDGTKIRELRMLADTATDFTESDIVQRHAKIIFGFVEFMNANQLLRND